MLTINIELNNNFKYIDLNTKLLMVISFYNDLKKCMI